jgi:hypothetical protein
MSLATKLKSKGKKKLNPESLWKGPEEDGITQSMLCGYLVCKERFRIGTIEGLGQAPQFNKTIEYGQMWHLCEEMIASGKDWKLPLKKYCANLCNENKASQHEINKWYQICLVQFPVYLDFWKKHPDVKTRVNLLPEISFNVPYLLSSGRTVSLRGKWDSVDVIGKGKQKGVYLQENKTKGDIKEEQLQRHLISGFELQTMIYLTALTQPGASEYHKDLASLKVKGVRYNVIRRPLSGGKGSIKQKKGSKNVAPETTKEFYDRLKNDYIESEPEYFFMRWKIEVGEQDLFRFQRECLNPILENLFDDYEWWDYCNDEGCNVFDYMEREESFPHHQQRHFRFPYGIYNPVSERGESDLDNYINSGDMIGLVRKKRLFGELA